MRSQLRGWRFVLLGALVLLGAVPFVVRFLSR